jgi:cytochrome c6
MRNVLALGLLLSSMIIVTTAAVNSPLGPIVTPPVAPASAAAIYAKDCAVCHGRDGRGKTTKGRFTHARDLSNAEWQNNVTDERMFNSISNGKGKGMPAFSKKLSDAEIDSLVPYIRRFKK